jgi:hypothetical protein
MKKLFTLSLGLFVGGSFAAAQQVGCQATTSSVVGSYTYTATELPFGGSAINPPGTTTSTGSTGTSGTTTTTGSTSTFSNTQIGNLISAINGGGAFANAGVLYFDGAGHISVASSTSNYTPSAVVGTYTVNTDCTITVTLNDVFNTTTGSTGVAASTSSLIGLVLGGGTEIELSAPQSNSSANGNTPLATNQFASRLMIQLIRTYAYGCTTASLSGSYGLVGNGYLLLTQSSTTGSSTGTGSTGTGSTGTGSTGTGSTGTGSTGTGSTGTTTGTTSTGTSQLLQPVSLLGVVNFDGAGHILPQIVPSGSPLGNFQYSGSYTVNLNCSGTMTLTPPTTTSTTTTTTGTTATGGQSWTLNFVLTPAVSYVTNTAFSASPGGNNSRPGLEFTLTNSTETLSGFGYAQ